MPENIDETTQARLADTERKNRAAEAAQVTLQKIATDGAVVAEEEPDRYIGFYAPVEKNTRVLVQAGKELSFPDKDSPRGRKLVEREGDIFVEFHDGVVVLDTEVAEDLVRLKWCLEHPETCRPTADPMTEAWAVLKEGQQPLAGRDAVIAQSMDVDRVIKGDPAGFAKPNSTLERVRSQLAQANA